jgi:hypothetical protein
MSMPVSLSPLTAAAVFTLPQFGGAFDPEFLAYLQEMGHKRRSILLFFPPKAAGTYLRSAAIEAARGQLMRVVHATGGRDASPYLPIFIQYFSADPSGPTMVTHAHMQAFPANRLFLEAFDLKPVIMLRSIPDMLCSYIDMLNSEEPTPEHWINSVIPQDFQRRDADWQADFAIDVMGPWYASYFSTWLDYAKASPERVCVLRYPDFKADPVQTLQTLLGHSGVACSTERCAHALEVTWRERALHRFNKAEQGRGRARFQDRHLAHLETLLFRYYDLSAHRAELMAVA